MQEPIQAFKVRFSESEISTFLESAKDIVSSGALIPGKYNAKLETEFASFVGTEFATAVGTGTIALEVIFRCLDLQKTQVLVPANTNYATAEAVISAGAQAVLYDSGLYPELANIKKVVTEQTKALVVVHIGGYITPEIEAIQKYCEDNNIYLIEDASHAHGSKYRQRSAGQFGIASAFSMFATKVITTSEGGIITTNNKEIASLGKVYRDQGKDSDGIHNIVAGSSWRMSELHAALGDVQMKHARDYTDRNNTIAKYYKANITASNRLLVPIENEGYYSGYKFILIAKNEKDRDSLENYLVENNIRPGKKVYDIPLHLQPALSFLNRGQYPIAENFASTHLCLPLWKGLTDDEMKRVVECVNHWLTISHNE